MNKELLLKIARKTKSAQGKREFINFLNDKKLTIQQSIIAMCYQCCGYYADGKVDCLIPSCPLYSYMPYKGIKEESNKILHRR